MAGAIRINGQDVSVFAVQAVDDAGADVGQAANFLADFETIKLDIERVDTDMTSTKDEAESARATHFRGTASVMGMQRSSSLASVVFAAGSYGLVTFTTIATGDAWEVPVFLSKLGLDVPGKSANKETLDFKINGVPKLNGQPLSL